MIRNIVFDMGNVLLRYEPMPACRAQAEREGDAQALYAAFFGGRLWVEVDHGRLDGAAFTGAVKALLEPRLYPAVDALWRGMPENIMLPLPGMDAVADDMLRRGFSVFLLSNAGLWMSRRRELIPHAGRFHGMMFSADEGLVKPDPRLYVRFTELHDLKPEECFFIDDSEQNVNAAQALGWQAYRFTGDITALRQALARL